VRLAAPAAALCALLAVPAVAGAAKPKPETGKSVVVERVSGSVTFQKRGSRRATRLGKARAVPLGSTIDATRGRVKLTSTADRRGRKRQSALFYDGAFTVAQRKANRPITDVSLVGGDFSGCAAERRRTGVFTAGRRAKRRLWGRGKGRFRTRGRNGSATVRGTTWLTEDDCAGTKALNREGKVQAESTDLEYQLDPGQSVIFGCNPDGIPGVVGLYCLAVLSQPAKGDDQPVDIVGFGIAAQTADGDYELCIAPPSGQGECGPFPFGPDEGGVRAAGVGCALPQVGSYAVGWRMRGVLIGALPFEIAKPLSEPFCVSEPPRPGIDPPAKLRPALAKAASGGS
jgi:hypothetical protein